MESRTAPDRLAPFMDPKAYSIREAIVACLSIFDEATAAVAAPNSIFDGQEMRAYYRRYHPEVQDLLEQAKVKREWGSYGRYYPELQELFEQFKLWVDSLGGAEKASFRLMSQFVSHAILMDMVKVFLRKIMHQLTYYITTPARNKGGVSYGLRGVSRCIESLDWIVKLIPIIQMRRRRSDCIFAPDKRRELRLYLEWLLDHDKVVECSLSDIQKLLSGTNLAKTLDDPSNLPETILRSLVPLFRDLDAELALLAYRAENARFGIGFKEFGLPEGLGRLILKHGTDLTIMSLVGKVLAKQSRLPEPILQELVPFLKYHDHLFNTWWSPPGVEDIFLNQPRLPETILHDIAALIQVPEHKADLIALEIVGEQYGHLPESPEAADILKQQRFKARHAALSILRRRSDYSPGLPEAVLQKILPPFGDPDAHTRRDAVSSVDSRPCLAESIVRDMAALLKDPNASVREAAVLALDRQSHLPDTILQDMVDLLLKDGYFFVRSAAANALGQRPHLSDAILQRMPALLKDPATSIKEAVFRAFDRQPHLPDTILHDIGELLKDPDASVRAAAVRALDQQLRLSDTILQDVRELLKGRDLYDQLAALRFFQKAAGPAGGNFTRHSGVIKGSDCPAKAGRSRRFGWTGRPPRSDRPDPNGNRA